MKTARTKPPEQNRPNKNRLEELVFKAAGVVE
jgi:hypothetical protein